MPGVLCVHVGLDASRGNGVDGDVLGASIDGKATGEGLNGGLGACVESVVGDAGHGRCNGGSQDDAAIICKVAQSVLGDEELAARIQAEDLVVDLFGDVDFLAESFHARIRDDDVKATEVADGFAE